MRVAAAAALPVVAVTLYFTFSRGAIGVAASALSSTSSSRTHEACSGDCRPPGCRWPSRCTGRTARSCSRGRLRRRRARAQGRTLALAVIGCAVAAGVLRALALPTDRRLGAVEGRRRARAGWRTRPGHRAVSCSGVAIVAFDLPDRIAEQHRAFERPRQAADRSDLRSRLTEVGDNGRLANWRVALDAASHDHPWRGVGAGTYQCSLGARPSTAAG